MTSDPPLPHQQEVEPKHLAWWRLSVPLVPWLVLFAVAICFDGTIADAVHDHGIAAVLRRHPHWIACWKTPGEFWFTAAVVAVGFLTQKLNWRQALFVVLSVACSGLNVIPKWFVGRTRPFKLGVEQVAHPFVLHPFRDGLYGFFHQQNLSFPSGHACTAFTLALAMSCVRPTLSVLFFFFAAAVGVERVLENAHYCSDVCAAVVVGWMAVALAWRIIDPTKFCRPLKPILAFQH